MLGRWFGGKKGKFAANHGIEHDLAIDWPTTRAFVAHAGMCGFLYLNLKGRQQTGVVEPGEYDKLREEIRQLEEEEMPRIAENIKLAREEGELGENAEYHGQRDNMRHLDARIKRIKSRLTNCYVA